MLDSPIKTNQVKTNPLLSRVFDSGLSLVDLRAPIEFARGSFPGARNLPILLDEERELVGIEYKQKGNTAALALGLKLVSGPKRQKRTQEWIDFLATNPDSLLFCFRGGLRSKIASQWIEEAGFKPEIIPQGYKKIRTELLEVFENQPGLLVLGGKTGAGKTAIIKEFEESVDLEGLACHRGSAFGRTTREQPTQINFENALAIKLYIKRDSTAILIEDEGKLIGRNYLPKPFRASMSLSPLVLLDEPTESRVENIWHEYIVNQLSEYESFFGEAANHEFSSYLQASLENIKKKLGNVLYLELKGVMSSALTQGKQEDHKIWIRKLLELYYDPMYEYQLRQKQRRVIFTGDALEIRHWLSDFYRK